MRHCLQALFAVLLLAGPLRAAEKTAPVCPLILPGVSAAAPASGPVVLGADGLPAAPQISPALAHAAAAPSAVSVPAPDALRDGSPAGTLFLAQSAAPLVETRLRGAAEAVHAAVAKAKPALIQSVVRDQWNGPNTSLDTPCCGDAAPKLAHLLRKVGLPAHVVEAEFHYYVVVTLPEGPVVVDPTVRQFFGGAQAPESVPQVFVGSAVQLSGLFARHAARKKTRYDVNRIYFRDATMRDGKLQAAAAAFPQ